MSTFPTKKKKQRSQKTSQWQTGLAWQQDPSTLISIGVVGGVVIEQDLKLGCLLMGSVSVNQKFTLYNIFCSLFISYFDHL